jgi:hypothetical protein
MNIVFFGAAALMRHVRLQPSPLGPGREEVDYRDSSEDPLNGHGNPLEVTGNSWSSPPTSWPTTAFVGEAYSGYLHGSASVPFVVTDASAWIYKGTGLHNGSELPGIIESDVDHVSPASPGNVQVLAHSPIPLSEMYTNQGKWGGYSYSDMTYYTAGVGDCPAGQVAAITGNILWLFGQGPSGKTVPSVPNLATVVPAGS